MLFSIFARASSFALQGNGSWKMQKCGLDSAISDEAEAGAAGAVAAAVAAAAATTAVKLAFPLKVG